MSPIGLAVIGAGYWGPNLIRAARVTPDFRLKYICDVDLARAQAVLDPYTPVQATSSYEQVLADPEVARSRSLPLRPRISTSCARPSRPGKHVLVEKPLTASVAEGEKLA